MHLLRALTTVCVQYVCRKTRYIVSGSMYVMCVATDSENPK